MTFALNVICEIATLNLMARNMLSGLLSDDTALGLSSPQFGLKGNITVIDPVPTYHLGRRIATRQTIVMINPAILITSNSTDIQIEGCTLFPDLYVFVERSSEIVVEYNTLNGNRIKRAFSNVSARVIQHEVDHLHGRTILDRLPRRYRKLYNKLESKKNESLKSNPQIAY